MIEYSIELINNVEKIIRYYEKYVEENDNFDLLQNIIKFMMECINNYIDDQYFVIPKNIIQGYMNEAIKTWDRCFSEKEINKFKIGYITKINELEQMLRKINEKEEEKWATKKCVLWMLYNGYKDQENIFVYDFMKLFILELEKIEIEEKYINETLEKYFKVIIE